MRVAPSFGGDEDSAARMPPVPRPDAEHEAQIEDVVRAVLAVLDGRSADASAPPDPGLWTRIKAGGQWVVKNTTGLLALGTFLLIMVGLVLHGIDPLTVPATLVEKYRQEQERTIVVKQHVALGNDLLNVDQVQAARQEFRDALKLDDSSAKASLGLLKTQLQSIGRGHPEPAVYERRLRQLISDYPGDSQVAAYYGSALLLSRNLAEAESAFDTALELDPNSAIAVGGKGNVADIRNEPQQALALYERAEAMSPNTPVFVNNAAYQRFRLGRYPQAIDTYERLLELDGSFLLPYYILSQAQRLTGALADAERTQHTLLRLLADRGVREAERNSRVWFFHTLPAGVKPQPKGPASAVDLRTSEDKRCYARLSHALTAWVAGRRRSAWAEIARARRIGLAPKALGGVLRILGYEAQTLAEHQPRWTGRIDAFVRDAQRRLT